MAKQNALRWTKILFLLSSTSLLVIMGFNCSKLKSNNSSGSNSSSNLGNSLSSKNDEPPVAMMTSEQLLKTMISVTGVEGLGDQTSSLDKNIAETYNERSGSLPSVNSLTQASGPTLIAITNLASRVCDKAVAQDLTVPEGSRAGRAFFREFDFGKGLAGQTSDGVIGGFSRLARNAWRREPTPEEINEIVSFSQNFAAGVDANSPGQSRMLAISICTAVLSSVDSYTY